MSLRCMHDINNSGECLACGATLRLDGFRLLLQPLFRDDTDDTTAHYAPIRMPTMRMSPGDLNALIANPDAAATTLQRLRDRKEDESE